MSIKTVSLGEGAEGLFIENERFGTTLLSLHFYIPLSADTISAAALLPYLLTTCSREYRDYTSLNFRLLELYGAELSCSVTKSADCLHIRISMSVINDEFAFDKESVVKQAAQLLLSLVFEPAVENGAFFASDVEREKRKTIERIEGEINNKRAFARTRLYAEMFGDDPYGIFEYGTVEGVKALDGKRLYRVWASLLKSGFIRFQVIGKQLPDGLFDEITAKLEAVDRGGITDVTSVTPLAAAENPRDVTEHYKVTQGKLVMGFSSRIFGAGIRSLPLLLCTDIFGGGPYSKLFTNVREKQSLCYYCSASSVRGKGFVVVDSGIEEANADKVLQAVLAELDEVKKGNFDAFSLEASRKSITDTLMAYYDNAAVLDSWYGMTVVSGGLISPEEMADAVRSITKEQIVAAANGLQLHTVYRLLPEKEGAEE